MSAARSGAPFRGISEPAWDVFGWHDVPESLPVTGMAVDAYCDALTRLGRAWDENHVGDLLDLLLRCRTERGGFAHNALIEGQEAAEVQNATASALNLLGRVTGGKPEGHPLYTGLDATVLRLRRGQGASGFWSYHYPGRRSKLKGALDRWPFTALLDPGRFSAHGHGDVTHHLMTLYFAAGYLLSRTASTETGMLGSGWGWIRERLVEGENRTLVIDWSGDPAPASPQCSQSRDTNAYFLILGALPRLASLGIVDRDESSAVAEALLAHIASSLTSEPGHMPCVTPCEGPHQIVRNVLPMFEQSVAWKGHLMAEIIQPGTQVTR